MNLRKKWYNEYCNKIRAIWKNTVFFHIAIIHLQYCITSFLVHHFWYSWTTNIGVYIMSDFPEKKNAQKKLYFYADCPKNVCFRLTLCMARKIYVFDISKVNCFLKNKYIFNWFKGWRRDFGRFFSSLN